MAKPFKMFNFANEILFGGRPNSTALVAN